MVEFGNVCSFPEKMISKVNRGDINSRRSIFFLQTHEYFLAESDNHTS